MGKKLRELIERIKRKLFPAFEATADDIKNMIDSKEKK